jgi:hypothetical protein
MAVEATYEVNATPVPVPEGDAPAYRVSIYRYIRAGICGPFTGDEIVGDVDACLLLNGYVRTNEFGALCQNGYRSAECVPVGEQSLRATG